MRRAPRTVRATTASRSSATRDSSGSSAAAVLMANRLIGRMYRIWAKPITDRAPIASADASHTSTNAENWTTPRPSVAGAKRASTVRTAASLTPSPGRIPGATPVTPRICTRNWSTPPTSTPHARASTAPAPVASLSPTPINTAISTAFHTTGATYERKNRRWALRTPRHQADNTSAAVPGNMIRTSVTVSSWVDSASPGAMRRVSGSASTTPTSATAAATAASNPTTAPARRRAASRSPRSIRSLYTGMNDADRAPSPSRFCSRLGIFKAARKASSAAPVPMKAPVAISRTSPAMRERKIPAATIVEPLARRPRVRDMAGERSGRPTLDGSPPTPPASRVPKFAGEGQGGEAPSTQGRRIRHYLCVVMAGPEDAAWADGSASCRRHVIFSILLEPCRASNGRERCRPGSPARSTW